MGVDNLILEEMKDINAKLDMFLEILTESEQEEDEQQELEVPKPPRSGLEIERR